MKQPGAGFLRALPLLPSGSPPGFFGAWARSPADFADLLPDPFDETVVRRTADAVAAGDGPRQATAEVLAETNRDLGGDADAVAAARRLGEPGTLAVVTGQQAGLFGGPLYSLAKAMSAVAAARELERTTGRAVVPVFWVEADDHDFEEIRTAWLLDRAGEPKAFRYQPHREEPGLSAARRRLDGTTTALLGEFAAALPPTDYRDEVVETLSAAYQPGRSLGEAFSRYALALTRGTGLVVMDGASPALKRLALPVYRTAAANLHEGRRRIEAATARIEAAGFTGQAAAEGYSIFTTGAAGARRRAREDELSPAALDPDPERLSAAVLLRPLVQDFLLPTVGYVGGPAEVAYHAQMGGLYAIHGIARPLVLPRHLIAVLNRSQVRVLDRDGIAFDELSAGDEAALNRRAADPATREAIGRARQAIGSGLDEVETAVSALNPSLRGAARRARGRMLKALGDLDRLAVRAVKRQDQERRGRFLRARNALFPGGVPQERRLGPAVFLNRYGSGFARWLLASFEDARADRRARNLLLG